MGKDLEWFDIFHKDSRILNIRTGFYLNQSEGLKTARKFWAKSHK